MKINVQAYFDSYEPFRGEENMFSPDLFGDSLGMKINVHTDFDYYVVMGHSGTRRNCSPSIFSGIGLREYSSMR